VLKRDGVDRETPRVETHRERSADHTDPGRARERLATPNCVLGLQQRVQTDQPEPERETAVQVCPQRQQRRPEPRGAPPIEGGEQQRAEEQGHDLGSQIEKPVTGGGDEPGRGSGRQPGVAGPPRVPRDQAEEHHEQAEIEPGREVGVTVVREPEECSPEPRVIGPGVTVCGVREGVGGWNLAVLRDVLARREMPPEIRAIDVRLRPRSRSDQDGDACNGARSALQRARGSARSVRFQQFQPILAPARVVDRIG